MWWCLSSVLCSGGWGYVVRSVEGWCVAMLGSLFCVCGGVLSLSFCGRVAMLGSLFCVQGGMEEWYEAMLFL